MGRKALTKDDVILIRRCYAERKRVIKEFSRDGLARKFGVATSTIDRVVDMQNWRKVTV